MSKFATMTGLINDAEKKPSFDKQRRCRTPEKLRPPPGNRQFLYSLSRSRSVTIASSSSHSMSKSKAPKLFVEKKSEIVRNKVKKSSKLRSFISIVFRGHRRRRSSSLSSISLSSSSRSSNLRSAMHKEDSNCEDNGKISGKYSSFSSSSSSSTNSIGGKKDGKKKKKKRHRSDGGGGNRGIIVNSLIDKARIGIEEKEEQCYELCKKKILMGVKCKPLNPSGKLSYDDDGVLVPEPLPP